ncbi:MAG: efflux RND transporter periplasmic adaptor subunit [Saprospiraceae bacterium]|nr:efflux RND transporter periplasmic adaptor subunit [Saprospiraceae bacterium]
MKLSQLYNEHIILPVVTIAVVTFLGCKSENASQKQADAEDKIQKVEVINPTPRSFTAELMMTGTAVPNQKVMLYAVESGYIRSISKDIGDRIRSGQIIAVLDNPEIEQLVSDAKTALDVGKAQLDIAEAEWAAAQAASKAKSSLYDRLKSIADKTPKLTPVSDVETAEAESLMAEAGVKTKEAELRATESQVAALQERLQIAEKRKGLLLIRAPFDGVITQRMVDRGALVQSGMTEDNPQAIVELQETDPIRLTIPVPESDASSIRVGMDAMITFPTMTGGAIQGMVSRLAGALDPASKTMQIEIDLDNPDGKILTGMYAKVLMQLESREQVLSLPVTTQIMYQDAPSVLVVEDNKVERIPLRKGLSSKDFFEVLNPEISPESQVIIQGKGLVTPGQMVKGVLRE